MLDGDARWDLLLEAGFTAEEMKAAKVGLARCRDERLETARSRTGLKVLNGEDPDEVQASCG